MPKPGIGGLLYKALRSTGTFTSDNYKHLAKKHREMKTQFMKNMNKNKDVVGNVMDALKDEYKARKLPRTVKGLFRETFNKTRQSYRSQKDTAYRSILSKKTSPGVKANKAAWGLGSFVTSPARYAFKAGAASIAMAVRNPIKTGIGLGVAHGLVKGVAQTADRRTMHMQKNSRGMSHNHLGTDGLTLSLSRTRHG